MAISNGKAVEVQLQIFEHEYISIASTVCSNIQKMQAGRKLVSTNLLTIMPFTR